MSCYREIKSGTRYYRWVGTSDVWIGLAVLKECKDCYERRYGHQIPNEEE